jgi:hypothetical protein
MEENNVYFVLALWDADEKASVKDGKGPELRALTSISLNTINFNISGYRKFSDVEAVGAFLGLHRHHFFFCLMKLVVVKVTERIGGGVKSVELAE